MGSDAARVVTARRLAWSIAGLSAGLAVLGLLLSVLAVLASGGRGAPAAHQFFNPVRTIAFSVVGALVASRHPRNPIGWILAAAGFLSGATLFSIGYSLYGQSAALGTTLPGAEVAGWVALWIWILDMTLPTTFLLLLFPDGHLLSPRWRWIAWAAALGTAGGVVFAAFHPDAPELMGEEIANPFALPQAAGLLELAGAAALALALVAVLGSIVSLVVRFRRSVGIERQQLKWLAYAGLLMILGFMVSGVPYGIWPEEPWVNELGIITTDAALVGIIVAAGIAILRHGLYDIDLLINRTLVYSALTASVIVLYVLVVSSAGLMLQRSRSLASALLTAVLAALVFTPLRARVQIAVDRLTYGERGPWRRAPHADPQEGTQEEQLASQGLGFRPHSVRWLKMARVAWVFLAVVAFGILLASLPAYALGLGKGPPAMVASLEGSARLVFLVDVANALASIGAAAVSLSLAVLLYRRRPADGMALYVSFFLLAYGIVMAGPLEELNSYWPGIYRVAVSLEFALATTPLMALLFLFPSGRFVPRWTRWLLLPSVLLMLVPVVLPLETLARSADLWGGLVLATLLATIGPGFGIYAQVYRYRHVSSRLERQQTKWAVFGLGVTVVLIGVLTIPFVLSQRLPAGEAMPWWAPASELGWFLMLNIPPLTLAIAVMRYRLWDIDVVINRTLLYGALTVAVVGIYVLVVGSLGLLLPAGGSLTISIMATGLVAVLFQPLRERLQRGVNHLLYGERDNPYTVLSRLGRRLEAAIAPEAVLPTIVETLAQALKLPYTAIALRKGGDLIVAAEYGRPVGEPVRLALSYQGETIGELVCAPRSPGEPFAESEHRLLEDVAHQAGVAVHAVRLTEDLQRSRERLVTAREEERRRLRRDLHDGLGPQLASLALKLDAVRNLAVSHPAEADVLLVELKTQVQDALADIRRLVYNLRPPALDELGLVPALRESASSQSTREGTRVSVEAPDPLPPLPAAVEVAAYRIALEAVTNVARHAQARRCVVRLSIREGLCLEITDDGIGLPPSVQAGVGLTSMRERAEELGGSCVVESMPDGGTRVWVQLPLATAGPGREGEDGGYPHRPG